MTGGRRRPRAARWIGIAATSLLLVLLATAACGGEFPQSTLDPASDVARMIDDLFTSIFMWAVIVFLVVEGILLYVVFRFRAREGRGRPDPVHGHTLLEVAWTAAPALILVMIAIPTIQLIWEIDNPPPPEADPLEVEVVAHQWWWEFRYPDLDVVTANELHVPVGRTVRLHLTSADVIHSFWVPRTGGKRDVMPGDTTGLWFTVEETGVYPGQCAEFCGTSHALMGMLLVARDSAEFRRWVARNRAPAPEPQTEAARRGREAFLNSVCITCHTVRGTPAEGTRGPDLTHVGSRRTIAAGILENTPSNMARWLRDPQRVKPGNLMRLPRPLDEERIELLTAYMESLR